MPRRRDGATKPGEMPRTARQVAIRDSGRRLPGAIQVRSPPRVDGGALASISCLGACRGFYRDGRRLRDSPCSSRRGVGRFHVIRVERIRLAEDACLWPSARTRIVPQLRRARKRRPARLGLSRGVRSTRTPGLDSNNAPSGRGSVNMVRILLSFEAGAPCHCAGSDTVRVDPVMLAVSRAGSERVSRESTGHAPEATQARRETPRPAS